MWQMFADKNVQLQSQNTALETTNVDDVTTKPTSECRPLASQKMAANIITHLFYAANQINKGMRKIALVVFHGPN